MHMCDVTHPVVWHDSFICFMRCPTSITRFACVLCKCMCSLFWPTYTYDMNMCDWDIKFCFCTHHSVSESHLASLSCWLSTHRSVAHSQLHLFYPSCLFGASCVCVCVFPLFVYVCVYWPACVLRQRSSGLFTCMSVCLDEYCTTCLQERKVCLCAYLCNLSVYPHTHAGEDEDPKASASTGGRVFVWGWERRGGILGWPSPERTAAAHWQWRICQFSADDPCEFMCSCCSVLQCVAVCCSKCSVLQCSAVNSHQMTPVSLCVPVAVCCSKCSVLQSILSRRPLCVCVILLQGVAVCCSVLQQMQCVAVFCSQFSADDPCVFVWSCCSVLQCVVVCCSVL